MIATRPDSPLFVFAGGGTGGHLYPAIAAAAAIRRAEPASRILFLGTDRAIDERILDTTEYDRIAQSLKPISRHPWRWPGMARSMHRAYMQCLRQFRFDTPAVVVGTGGLGSVPAMLAARRLGLPTALFNPDALPGKANRHLAPRVDAVYTQWDPDPGAFHPRTRHVTVGCPVRTGFLTATREMGLEHFELDPSRHTLLVTGASQGARNVNDAVIGCLDVMQTRRDWQLLHLTGTADESRVRLALGGARFPAHVVNFTDDMDKALACADLVVARAGASTLAEISAAGRASILMPYPFHRDRHQYHNARKLAESPNGEAAVIIDDACNPAVNAERLRSMLLTLMNDDARRAAMADAARATGRPDAAERIGRELLELAGGRPEACEILERR